MQIKLHFSKGFPICWDISDSFHTVYKSWVCIKDNSINVLFNIQIE